MPGLNVAVIGAGGVGTTLGNRLLQAGNKVVYGSRDPASSKIAKVLELQPSSTADTIDGAVTASDVILLTTPGTIDEAAVSALAKSLGEGVKGKVLIDATNPLTGWPALAIPWGEKSGGEVLQEALPDTYVFKAFNTLGVDLMDKADGSTLGGTQLTLLFAGAGEKVDTAASIISDVGFKPEYVGPIRYAKNLEAIAELWIHLSAPPIGFTPVGWGRNFNFQVIKE